MTPDDERPGVHEPEPFLSHPSGLNTADSTPLCVSCKSAPAEVLRLTSELCPDCHFVWHEELIRKDDERKRHERERTVGRGGAYAPADGYPTDHFYLKCDRCPRVWVGRDGVECDACLKWRCGSSDNRATR